jgi:hypothetical protein
MLAFLEVTDKTGALGNGYVFALDDLRVAACALEFFPSFEVLEMNFVVERDLVKLHLTLKESFVMAAFPKATIISDFCPWFGFDIEFCPVSADHDQPFHFFSQFGTDAPAWGIMTHAALHILVGGCFPAFEKGFHIMTGSTKIRMGREFYRTQRDNDEKSQETEKNNESFFLFFHFWHFKILNI